MIKYIAMLFVTVLTSMYFFPFEFSFLPGANTKMMMAGVGLVWLFVNLSRGTQQGGLNRDLFNLSVWAMLISIISFAGVTFNETYDYTFVTYVVSMWVWLGGAYSATQMMRALHGYLNVELICHYLIAVCVGQCLIAYGMDQLPALKDFVDGFLGSTGFMGKVDDRLYGIGASLDVGGMRFAAVLLIISYLTVSGGKALGWWRRTAYILSFLIIVYIGNMIGRTTTVGAGMALCYWLYAWVAGNEGERAEAKKMWLVLGSALLVLLPVIIHYYHTNATIHSNIRFAFEGFFSLAEKGRWETHSNEILKNMYVLPDNTKTWLIGDGYFDNPYDMDPYYTGLKWGGFYHGTDVGYLRFIFYAGIFCMLAFVAYMFKVAQVCMRRFKGYALLFFALLVLNYVVWCKVSSDLFPVFAIFLCITARDLEEAEQMESEEDVPKVMV